jgi:hypothetical protein
MMNITTLPLTHSTYVGVIAGLTHGILHDAAAAAKTHGAVALDDKRSWLDRLDSWLWNQEVQSREAFFSESADAIDLENRQRWLERRTLTRRAS